MEVSKLIKLGVLSLCLSLLGALSSNSAQEVPAIHQETILSFVHDLLQVFYPEAFTKDMQLNLCISHPADASWREISGVYFRVTARNFDADPALIHAIEELYADAKKSDFDPARNLYSTLPEDAPIGQPIDRVVSRMRLLYCAKPSVAS